MLSVSIRSTILHPQSPRALGDGMVGRARAPRGIRAMVGGKDGRAADPTIPARPIV